MGRQDKIDFLREVVRLAEVRLDDIYASYDAIGNKARLIIGFSAAVLVPVYQFVLSPDKGAVDGLWCLGAVAALCLVLSVLLSLAVLMTSDLHLKGLRSSSILRDSHLPFDIDQSIFGGDLAIMLTSLLNRYDRIIGKDGEVLRKKQNWLGWAQVAFGTGLVISIIVFAIELIAKMINVLA